MIEGSSRQPGGLETKKPAALVLSVPQYDALIGDHVSARPRPLAAPQSRWLAGPALFLALWAAFAIGAELAPPGRFLLAVGVAAAAGAAAEVAARLARAETVWARESGTLWVLPAAAVLGALAWLPALASRPSLLAPLAALAVLGLIAVEVAELVGPYRTRPAAHAVSIGIGFALAFVAYLNAAHLPRPGGVFLVALASLAVSVVILRGPGIRRRDVVIYGVPTGLVVAAVSIVLMGANLPPVGSAALLVVAAYAASGTTHAWLDAAPRRAYLELAAVALAAVLAIAAATLAR